MFDSFFHKDRYENSEATFTYYYMWRKAGNIRWGIAAGCLCILLDFSGRPFAFSPFGVEEGKFPEALAAIEDHFRVIGKPFYMRGITGQTPDLFARFAPDRYVLSPNRESFDYLYRGDDLRQLAGRRYAGKRNHIHAFMKEYSDYRYQAIDEVNLPDCIAYAEKWFERHKATRYLAAERTATMDILQQFLFLGLKGAVIEVDGKIEALTLGEALGPDVAVIHTEKANAAMRGLYQVINRDFCCREWADKEYINREEDMGVEGLRTAKLSYYPCRMVEKYQAIDNE
ncbi:MAG: phosphatidylglycerol lysyltransferase domain-containing protein [Negativicutes bacterium]|nr:phosphatidylglycerol lysyltransferase domain-containing protein [Negativicutes bacterium]